MPGKQEMRTPPWLFALLDARFGPFVLDAAAEPHNALCRAFYAAEDDGLVQPWVDRTFCNPPFKNFGEWMEKAVRERVKACLIGPVGCSQSWFHEFAPKGRILVPNQRINFLMPDGTPTKSADRDTMIYLFGYGGTAWRRFFVEPLDVRAAAGRPGRSPSARK